MFYQIKSIILLIALLSGSLLSSAQYIDLQKDSAKLDSLRQLITKQLDTRLLLQQKKLLKQLEQDESLLDSLRCKIEDQEESIIDILAYQDNLSEELQKANEDLSVYMVQSEEKDRKIRQILFISGPTILLFLLISVVLFSIIIVRQQNETDKKINALKKYTYSEIEETKVVLLKKFRKRLKKMGLIPRKKNKKAR